MPDVVEFRRDGDVAVITVDNPPVNALTRDARPACPRRCNRRATTPRRSRGDRLRPAAPSSPAPTSPNSASRRSRRPCTTSSRRSTTCRSRSSRRCTARRSAAASKLALGCHFRVAAPGTRLGLPEIKLGLMPGAGGTQRLPRLVGIDKALAMILSGDPIAADRRRWRTGLVDEIADGDLTAAAVAFARTRAARRDARLRRVRDREDKLEPLRAEPGKVRRDSPRLTRSARADCMRLRPRSRHCAGRSTCRSTRR